MAIYAIRARYKEFCAVAKLIVRPTIVRIETAMEIYNDGVFIADEPLYPSEHKALGSEEYEHGKNIFLSQAYILVVFGLLSISLGILA